MKSIFLMILNFLIFVFSECWYKVSRRIYVRKINSLKFILKICNANYLSEKMSPLSNRGAKYLQLMKDVKLTNAFGFIGKSRKFFDGLELKNDLKYDRHIFASRNLEVGNNLYRAAVNLIRILTWIRAVTQTSLINAASASRATCLISFPVPAAFQVLTLTRNVRRLWAL